MGCDELVLLREVEWDLAHGKAFYERRQSGLGEYFKQCLLADLESLKVYAGVHVTVSKNLHRMRSNRFPFAIYYRVQDKMVYVLAILPMRRRPIRIVQTLEARSKK